MKNVPTPHLDEAPRVLEAEDTEPLRAAFGPQLVLPGDAQYETARRVWNGMIDRRPAAVCRCRGAADVAAAIRFARDRGLPLSVRGGGHNVAGFGTCDGGVVIDLSPLRGVRVDPDTHTVRVGGGATWADVDRETQMYARAVPGGIVSTTGVAGLTLGGGQGWLRRTFGMACDSLLSADLVTAGGEAITASEERRPELFWALRGGGGNFGVVTSFEFRTHPVGPMVAFAGPVYPLESAAGVMEAVRDFAAGAPDAVNVSATWWTIPAVPGFPEALHGRPVIIVGAAFSGAPEQGERILEPLRHIEPPLLDLSGTLPYVGLQSMFDPFFPAVECLYYWKSIYLAALDAGAVKTIAAHVASRPSSRSMVGLWALGGALGRVPAGATATGDRSAPYLLEILANWTEPAASDANVAWARGLFDAMQPFGTGKTNFNFPGFGDEPHFVRAAFGSDWTRLREVKKRYDPDNVFRLNQNVPPAR